MGLLPKDPADPFGHGLKTAQLRSIFVLLAHHRQGAFASVLAGTLGLATDDVVGALYHMLERGLVERVVPYGGVFRTASLIQGFSRGQATQFFNRVWGES